MIKLVRLFLLTILFVLAKSFGDSATGMESENAPANPQQLREAGQIDSFLTALNKKGYFNGTALVSRSGEIVYHKSFGTANRSTGVLITNDMPYQMASVSKPVTAAAIMLLVQKGEIGLDDRISKYFPELVVYHKVTVRHLLNHTSGIPEYIYRTEAWWKKEGYMSNDDLLKFLAQKKFRLSFTPGSRYSYCNTNYALLASIVERVTEQRFPAFVKEEILDPIGMCKSFFFNPETDSAAAAQITGYRWTGKRWLPYGFDYRNGIVGDKGLYATADDMMRFARAFGNDWLWCNETCNQIFCKTTVWGNRESEYGLGWRMREWDGHNVVLHYGFWNSFRTGLIHFPDSDVTLVILNNFTGGSGSRVNNRELIINELMKIMFPPPAPPLELADEQESDSTDALIPSEGGGEDSGQ